MSREFETTTYPVAGMRDVRGGGMSFDLKPEVIVWAMSGMMCRKGHNCDGYIDRKQKHSMGSPETDKKSGPELKEGSFKTGVS